MLSACGYSPGGASIGRTAIPSISGAVAALSCRSCLIDGEVVICDDDGIPVFDRCATAGGLRPTPSYSLSTCRARGQGPTPYPARRPQASLATLLRRPGWALHFNDHIDEAGDIVFRHACQLGFEGIVSKRLGSPYLSGRSRHWIKSKNPAAPAVKREAEEDWGKEKRR